MSALLRDAWIQVFGGVAVLCLIIMVADHLAARPPETASASAAASAAPAVPPLTSHTASAIQHPAGQGGLSRPFDAPGLSAPAPVRISAKPVPSPLPIPPDDSDLADDGEPAPVPARPANRMGSGTAEAPPAAAAKEPVKILRLNNQARWNKDIFRKKK